MVIIPSRLKIFSSKYAKDSENDMKLLNWL